MSLRRTFLAICAMVLSMATLAPNSGWARVTTGSQSQAPAWNGGGAAVTKDGSQMTVVGGGLDRDIPIVDVANNSKLKKKAPPSFWSRLSHPSQWFGGGSSKSKK